MSGVMGLFLFTALHLTLSIPFKVEEIFQLSFRGLTNPASQCIILMMFKYWQTDQDFSLWAIAVFSWPAGAGGMPSFAQKSK